MRLLRHPLWTLSLTGRLSLLGESKEYMVAMLACFVMGRQKREKSKIIWGLFWNISTVWNHFLFLGASRTRSSAYFLLFCLIPSSVVLDRFSSLRRITPNFFPSNKISFVNYKKKKKEPQSRGAQEILANCIRRGHKLVAKEQWRRWDRLCTLNTWRANLRG